VHNLHVHSHLATVVGDDEDTNAAAARLKGLLEAAPEAALVNDGEVLLDITSLSHGDNGAILHVEDTVLLEDRAEHGLDNDAGGGVGDERRLLMELLGEEVDAKVAVLTGGGRGRDADDLAGAALEDENVAEADVVAGDGHGVGGVSILRRRHAGATASLASLSHLDTVMTVLVVVTHLGFLGGGSGVTGCVDGLFGELDVRLVEDGTRSGRIDCRLAYADRLLGVSGSVTGGVDGGLVDTNGLLEGGTVARAVNGGADYVDFVTVVGLETGAVFTLGDVDDWVVRAVRPVDLNAGFGVRRLRASVMLFAVVLLTDAGTAVSFLFTSDVDLFFTEAMLRARREFDLGLERRVLTFPSGVLGDLDL
jgi:hypothetical protein